MYKQTYQHYHLLCLNSLIKNSSDNTSMDAFVEAYLPVPDRNGCLIQSTDDESESQKVLPSNSGIRQLTDLPPEIVQLILRNLKFENIARLRLVSKYFNGICSFILNSEFNHLRTIMLQKFQGLKALMPRRESARRKHALAPESEIIETLHMRLSLLHMTFGKHIERKYCCFFPGEILDEIYRILQYVKREPTLNRAYKVTDELFDLSTMAMEYFKDHIKPSLPEISYLTSDLLEHPSLIKPSTDLAINKTQLLNLECSNTIQDMLVKPTNDHLSKFRKQLKKTKEMTAKNSREILKVKRFLKIARKRVTAVVKELQQVKWQQKNCKEGLLPEYSHLNRIFEIKEQQTDLIASCPSESISPSCKLNSSDALNDKKCDVFTDDLQGNTKKQEIGDIFHPIVVKLCPVVQTSFEKETKHPEFPAVKKNANKRVLMNHTDCNKNVKRPIKRKKI